MCAPVTAVKEIYAVGCRRRRATIRLAVDVHAAESIPKIDPCRGKPLRTLLSSRCCACIALLDDPSAIGLTGPFC